SAISMRLHKQLFRSLLYQAILAVFASISLLGNSLLIVLILQRQSRELGTYRWLLLAFAIGDITISMFHAWRGLTHTPIIGFALNTAYCILFYEPFIILMFHFIYRYLKIFKENVDDNFFGEELLEVFGINTTGSSRPSLILMNFVHSEARGGGVNWTTIRAIGDSGVVACLTLGVNAYCSARIVRAFDKSNSMSVRTKRLQMQLFQALLVQFLVPFVLCFVPFSIIVALPLTGIRFGETGNIIANAVSIFPAVDAFMVILMVGR
ncbi:hypothetical protein PMAYCL1PPCAC_16797, partial [Pristionchus mayeri]